MSDDPILAHYRLMTDAQRREELAKDGITEEWRRKLVIVIGESEAAGDQERSAMDLRMAVAAERAATASERAAAAAERASTSAEAANRRADRANIIAIIAIITAAILSAPMTYGIQSLIRFLHP